MAVADTIRQLTKQHLLNGGILGGQCLTAVGFCANTVPSDLPNNQGILELPTSDSSNGGVLVGIALAGKRPIYLVRYQGFMTYNLSSIVNYAAKSKEMWQTPCPIFVRAIGMEGRIGPVATGMHHSMAVRYPGLKVVAPMTSGEWTKVWGEFLNEDDPVYCSEHRLSYKLDQEFPTKDKGSPVTIIGIGAGRLNIPDEFNEVHLYRLKPLVFTEEQTALIKKSPLCVVVDSDYPQFAQSVAYYWLTRGVRCLALGLADKTAGFAHDVLTPNKEEIRQYVKDNLLGY